MAGVRDIPAGSNNITMVLRDSVCGYKHTKGLGLGLESTLCSIGEDICDHLGGEDKKALTPEVKKELYDTMREKYKHRGGRGGAQSKQNL